MNFGFTTLAARDCQCHDRTFGIYRPLQRHLVSALSYSNLNVQDFELTIRTDYENTIFTRFSSLSFLT